MRYSLSSSMPNINVKTAAIDGPTLAALAQSMGRLQQMPGHMSLTGSRAVQSHESYTQCGLGSESTDYLVDAVRARMTCHQSQQEPLPSQPQSRLYGAKITGGGCGGMPVCCTLLLERGMSHHALCPAMLL